MELVRDVLDKQILDGEDCKVGKADGLIIALRKGRPPRVIAIELGVVTLARRIHRRLGDWVERRERAWGFARTDAVRIRFEHIVETGIDVRVNVEAKRTGARKWEDWLAANVIGRIPGSHR